MIQIPKLFQSRISKIIKDYENKMNLIQEKYKEKTKFYYNKMVDIKNEMEQIYEDEDLAVMTKGEKIVKLTATFEKFVDKYEEPKREINKLEVEFEQEITKIVEMIHQYKPEIDIKDINETVIKYIISNSK